MRTESTETEIRNTCLAWLNTLPGCRFFKRNTGAVTIPATETTKARFVRFNETGMVDIWGVFPGGKHVEIEIKRPGKKPTEEQYRYLAEMLTCGCIVYWADSIEMCVEKTRELWIANGRPWQQSWEI